MNELIQYTSADNHVLITITNGKANAISHEVIDALNTAFDNAEKEEKPVILTGQNRNFLCGLRFKKHDSIC